MDRQDRAVVDVAPHAAERPDADGKFSLNEDWVATGLGLALLVLCLLGLVPNIGKWW